MQSRVWIQEVAGGGLDLASGWPTGGGTLGASTASGGAITVDGAGAFRAEAGAGLPEDTSQQEDGTAGAWIVWGRLWIVSAGQQG